MRLVIALAVAAVLAVPAAFAGCRGNLPADCGDVAEQLTSIELGNYAEPEDRAPVVDRYRAACVAQRVTRREAECLDAARERWTAARCVRRLFPEMGLDGDCGEVTAAMARMMGPNAAANPQTAAMLAAMNESCVEDRWPDDLKACLIASNGQGC